MEATKGTEVFENTLAFAQQKDKEDKLKTYRENLEITALEVQAKSRTRPWR